MPGSCFIRHRTDLTGPIPLAELQNYVQSPSWTAEHRWSVDGLTWRSDLAIPAGAGPAMLPWTGAASQPARPAAPPYNAARLPEPAMVRLLPVISAGMAMLCLAMPLLIVPARYGELQGVWFWSFLATGKGRPVFVAIVLIVAAVIGLAAAIISLTTRGTARIVVNYASAGSGLLLTLVAALLLTGPSALSGDGLAGAVDGLLGLRTDAGVAPTFLLGALGLVVMSAAIPAASYRRREDHLAIRLLGAIAGGLGALLLLTAAIVGLAAINSISPELSQRRTIGACIALPGLLSLMAAGVLLSIAAARLSAAPLLARIAWHLAVWPAALPILGGALLSALCLPHFALGVSCLAMLLILCATTYHVLWWTAPGRRAA
jgi:hypothetical protein